MDPRVESLPVNRSMPKVREILCPYGCTLRKGIDERGYCKHLVGFTVDGVTMELRTRWKGREICGAFTEPLRKSDVMVQMATQTFRVYRKDGTAPVRMEPPEKEVDEDIQADNEALVAAVERRRRAKREDEEAEKTATSES